MQPDCSCSSCVLFQLCRQAADREIQPNSNSGSPAAATCTKDAPTVTTSHGSSPAKGWENRPGGQPALRAGPGGQPRKSFSSGYSKGQTKLIFLGCWLSCSVHYEQCLGIFFSEKICILLCVQKSLPNRVQSCFFKRLWIISAPFHIMPLLYIIIGTLGTSPLKSVQVKIKLSVFTANSLPPHSPMPVEALCCRVQKWCLTLFPQKVLWINKWLTPLYTRSQ